MIGVKNVLFKSTLGKLAVYAAALFALASQNVYAQDLGVKYALAKDPSDPLIVRALMIPNDTDSSVTLTGIGATVQVPKSLIIRDGSGATVSKISTADGSRSSGLDSERYTVNTYPMEYLRDNLGIDEAILENSSFYRVTFNITFEFQDLFYANTPIELFKFKLEQDCVEGETIKMAINDAGSPAAIATVKGLNIKNLVYVDYGNGDGSADRYEANATGNHASVGDYAPSLACPLTPPSTVMTAKLALEGALINNSTYGSYVDVMRTDLASNGLIPTTSPYDGVTTTAVDYVANSIVDWVKIELRSASDAAVLIAAQDALLKADGSIMMPDGAAGLVFPSDVVPAGSYYVVAKHRNHLAIMTADPIALSGTSVAVDFTDPSVAMYHGGSNATDGSQRVVISATLKAMRMGDADKDGTVNFFNDKTAVYNVMKDDINQNMLNIYNSIDLDLDGDAVFFSEGNLSYNNVLNFDGYDIVGVNSIIITTVPAITSGN